MCAALFIKRLRQLGFCRLLDPRGAALRSAYTVQPATFGVWEGTRYVLLTVAFKKITRSGSMMRFPIHKGY